MSGTNTSYNDSYSSESHHGHRHRRHRKKCDSSYSRDCHNTSRCSDDCGIKCSETPIGVWNLVFEYETTTTTSNTTSTTLQRPSQLLLNEGGTFTNTSTPDLKNNPFGDLLSTGVGVWKEVGDRKLKLDGSHIAYKASDGSPVAYYRVHIVMKANHRGNRARFRGCAEPKMLSDPTLCSDMTSLPTIHFSGCADKILEPGY